jgi:TetR/AcrR family transcriptional regulator, transcriptional repressor for nem operon
LNRKCPPPRDDAPLERVYRRLDAIAALVRRREHRKGGCIIGNLSTALADTHEAFRQRLADCFDEMAREFLADLEAAASSTVGRWLVTW